MAQLKVSEEELLQTLSKKGDNGNQTSQSDRYKKKVKVVAQAKNLSSHGSFVHGSEDEFKGVRIATIETMGQLGKQYLSFATEALPFMVDMFNDEDVIVRIAAVKNIVNLNRQLKVDGDTMKSIILILRDGDPKVRQYARQMLSCLLFQKCEDFEKVISVLVSSIRSSMASEESAMLSVASVTKNHLQFAGLSLFYGRIANPSNAESQVELSPARGKNE